MPAMTPGDRAVRLHQWKRAVERAAHWVE
jgi:hypothetical protein